MDLKRFLRLQCGVQHYPWGGRRHGDRPPFIAELLGEDDDAKPYAELWIGDHTRLPADVAVDDRLIPLPELLQIMRRSFWGRGRPPPVVGHCRFSSSS